MFKNFKLSVVLASVLSACSSNPAYAEPLTTSYEYSYAAVITNVVDGDTYDAEVDLGFNLKNTVRIRLRDVDTPELRGVSSSEKSHGKLALEYASKELLHKDVILKKVSEGVYNRYSSDVIYQDESGRLVSFKDQLIQNDLIKKSSY